MPNSPVKGSRDQHLLEVGEFARTSADVHLPVAHDGHASRVVAAVFEPPKALDENGQERFGADVAHDAAHDLVALFLSGRRASAAQPGLFVWRERATASDSAGTSSVIDEPAAT